MQWKKPMLLTCSIAVTLAVAQAKALCAADTAHTIVRGHFVACENADAYLQAVGIYERYERDLEAVIDLVGEENREEVIRRMELYESPLSPLNPDFEARVIVIEVDLQASIALWARGNSDVIEFKEDPRETQGTMRYWWRGSVQTCEQMTALSQLDLWVYPECCDTFEFAAAVCILEMDYAELAPAVMSDALTLAAEGA
jgi:hypothetical protein